MAPSHSAARPHAPRAARSLPRPAFGDTSLSAIARPVGRVECLPLPDDQPLYDRHGGADGGAGSNTQTEAGGAANLTHGKEADSDDAARKPTLTTRQGSRL